MAAGNCNLFNLQGGNWDSETGRDLPEVTLREFMTELDLPTPQHPLWLDGRLSGGGQESPWGKISELAGPEHWLWRWPQLDPSSAPLLLCNLGQ